MKIKVNKATPLQIDYLVAKCKGFNVQLRHDYLRQKAAANNYKGDDLQWIIESSPNDLMWEDTTGVTHFIERYSTDWAQGGPIIECERINVKSNLTRMEKRPDWGWMADSPENAFCVSIYGNTPLIAAMRCYVVIKLGEEVEIPEELI